MTTSELKRELSVLIEKHIHDDDKRNRLLSHVRAGGCPAVKSILVEISNAQTFIDEADIRMIRRIADEFV
jgi:hypothetical protein